MSVPPWYLDATARMKATRRHGVALVVPDTEPDRSQFAELWCALLESHNQDIREILAEAVFYALGTDVAKDTVRRPGETANCILLSPDARVISGDFVNFESVLAEDRFIRTFRRVLHGKDGARLKASADAVWADLPPADRQSIESWNEDEVRTLAPTIMPWLVWRRISEKDERAADLIRSLLMKGLSPAPVGMERQGTWHAPCLGCGMARMPEESRRFLAFLSPKSTADSPGFWSETI